MPLVVDHEDRMIGGMAILPRPKPRGKLRSTEIRQTHLLGVLEVLEQGVVVLRIVSAAQKHIGMSSAKPISRKERVTHPSNALVDVGGGVRETVDLTGLSAKETVKVRSDLVGLSGT
jgi:hypothetical protein